MYVDFDSRLYSLLIEWRLILMLDSVPFHDVEVVFLFWLLFFFVTMWRLLFIWNLPFVRKWGSYTVLTNYEKQFWPLSRRETKCYMDIMIDIIWRMDWGVLLMVRSISNEFHVYYQCLVDTFTNACMVISLRSYFLKDLLCPSCHDVFVS